MQISGIASDTGEERTDEIPEVSLDNLKQLTSLDLSSKQLKARIDNLSISADVKVLLFQIATKVLKVGETVIRIGQKVIEAVLKVLSMYPHTSFRFVFGAIAGALIGSIPLIGWVLGPLVTPILMALGLLSGAMQDFSEKAIETRVKASLTPFAPLKS